MEIELSLDIDDANGYSDPEVVAQVIAIFVDAMARCNMLWIVGNQPPPLYQSGVVYRVEHQERFEDYASILQRGFADCEDLSAVRIAELRLLGYQAEPYVSYQQRMMQQNGRILPVVMFHVKLQYFSPEVGDWVTEDPSAELGMGRELSGSSMVGAVRKIRGSRKGKGA